MSQHLIEEEVDIVLVEDPSFSVRRKVVRKKQQQVQAVRQPSIGLHNINALCSDIGLKVQIVDGRKLIGRGVIPLPGTGGLVIAHDRKGKVYQYRAKSVVRFMRHIEFPQAFPGWTSAKIIPVDVAEHFYYRSQRFNWGDTVAILGSGNRALRFASRLLEESTIRKVCVVEASSSNDHKKPYRGWEVEFRRFSLLGGRFIQGKLHSFKMTSRSTGALRVETDLGVQIIDVGCVVSAGPFQEVEEIREYPPASFLYEITKTAPAKREDDYEGWMLEEQRGRWLGAKIAKALLQDLGKLPGVKDRIEHELRKSRLKLKLCLSHREDEFEWAHSGKWSQSRSREELLRALGVPSQAFVHRPLAAIECLEDIPCDLCQKSCPESAISISRETGTRQVAISELDCTACGQCLQVCPSRSISLVHEGGDTGRSTLTLNVGTYQNVRSGELVSLVNRKGDRLGTGRVTGFLNASSDQLRDQLVRIDLPTHLAWEARGFEMRNPENQYDESLDPMEFSRHAEEMETVKVRLNGETRRIIPHISVSQALYEAGLARSSERIMCPDGSCQRCSVEVNGKSQLACQTLISENMSIQTEVDQVVEDSDWICECLEISKSSVVERIRQGKLSTPDAVLVATQACQGKCHGRLCSASMRRVMTEEGIDASQWIPWQFPWADWTIEKNP